MKSYDDENIKMTEEERAKKIDKLKRDAAVLGTVGAAYYGTDKLIEKVPELSEGMNEFLDHFQRARQKLPFSQTKKEYKINKDIIDRDNKLREEVRSLDKLRDSLEDDETRDFMRGLQDKEIETEIAKKQDTLSGMHPKFIKRRDDIRTEKLLKDNLEEINKYYDKNEGKRLEKMTKQLEIDDQILKKISQGNELDRLKEWRELEFKNQSRKNLGNGVFAEASKWTDEHGKEFALHINFYTEKDGKRLNLATGSFSPEDGLYNVQYEKKILEGLPEGQKKAMSTYAETMQDMAKKVRPEYARTTSNAYGREDIAKKLNLRRLAPYRKIMKALPVVGAAAAIAEEDYFSLVPVLGDLLSSGGIGPKEGSEDWKIENPERYRKPRKEYAPSRIKSSY